MIVGVVPRLLFVCLGNICRTPLAEGAMRAAASRVGLPVEVDSAGTGDWHVGSSPDPRAIAAAARNGVDIAGLRARRIAVEDFMAFDHVIALDRDNLTALRALEPAGSHARISLLLDHCPSRTGQAVADPYFGDDAGFDTAWRDIMAGVEGLIAELSAQPRG